MCKQDVAFGVPFLCQPQQEVEMFQYPWGCGHTALVQMVWWTPQVQGPQGIDGFCCSLAFKLNLAGPTEHHCLGRCQGADLVAFPNLVSAEMESPYLNDFWPHEDVVLEKTDYLGCKCHKHTKSFLWSEGNLDLSLLSSLLLASLLLSSLLLSPLLLCSPLLPPKSRTSSSWELECFWASISFILASKDPLTIDWASTEV